MPKRDSPKLKFQILLELRQSEKTIGKVAKAYVVHSNSARKWKKKFLKKGPEVFAKDITVAEYECTLSDL
ncbi:MAG: hypothetical protein R6U51_09520 [Anaerolineales bacterium]